MSIGPMSETGAEQLDAEPQRESGIGPKVVRGGSVRAAGYSFGTLLTAGASVLLLRHLGVKDFGRYMIVASLVAIVSGLTDAGLTAVGARDLALRQPGDERQKLLANLLGLRLVLTPLGVLAATGFAIAVGYSDTLVLGTVLAGAGLVLASYQATMTLPLSVELRIGRLTLADVTKQAAVLIGIAILVAAGAGLQPFFALAIGVAALSIAMTPALLGRSTFVWRPAFDRREWRALVRETLPLAASVVMGVFYLRLLVVFMSLLASAAATGFFAVSFRIVDMLYAASALVSTTLLPVLAVAVADRVNLDYMLARMSEVALIAACYLAVMVAIVAEPAISLLGGQAYRAAAPVLRIEVFALIPVFLAHEWQVGLISLRRRSALMVASGVSLAVVLALGFTLIPLYGAQGAAVAAVAAEVAFASSLLVILLRSGQAMPLQAHFLLKLALATGVAVAPAFIPGLPAVAAAAAGTVAFGLTLGITGAVPREVIDALPLRI